MPASPTLSQQHRVRQGSPEPKPATNRQTGTVNWWNDGKGFGFIEPDGGGNRLHVHHTKIKSKEQFKTLAVGDRVTYDAELHGKDTWAVNVERIPVG